MEKVLWHYTSASALPFIFCNKGKIKLRFTHVDYLNDSTEGKDVIACFRRVIKKMKKGGQISPEFYDSIKDLTPLPKHPVAYPKPIIYPNGFEDKNGCFVLDCRETEVFVFCCSKGKDLLDMWRYYSKGDGGYAIKIDVQFFDEANETSETQGTHCHLSCFDVIYDDEEKSNYLESVVKKAYGDYENPEKLQQIIRWNLRECQYVFKHSCFASEKETRIVYYRMKDFPSDCSAKQSEIQYRSSNGILIPYIDFEFSIPDKFLNRQKNECIIVSPFIKDKQFVLAKESVENLLKANGFFDPIAKSSKLPVRF